MALEELVAARIHPAHASELRERAFLTGVSVSALIRRAIENMLESSPDKEALEDHEEVSDVDA